MRDSISSYYSDETSLADYYIFNSDNSELERYRSLEENDKLIKDMNVYKSLYGSVNISVNGNEKFNEDRTLIIELYDYRNVDWKLTIIKQIGNSICPDKGEIWISQIFPIRKILRLEMSLVFHGLMKNTKFQQL